MDDLVCHWLIVWRWCLMISDKNISNDNCWDGLDIRRPNRPRCSLPICFGVRHRKETTPVSAAAPLSTMPWVFFLYIYIYFFLFSFLILRSFRSCPSPLLVFSSVKKLGCGSKRFSWVASSNHEPSTHIFLVFLMYFLIYFSQFFNQSINPSINFIGRLRWLRLSWRFTGQTTLANAKIVSWIFALSIGPRPRSSGRWSSRPEGHFRDPGRTTLWWT